MKNLNLLVLFGIFQFIISCSEKVEPINDEEASEIARDIDGNEYDVVLVNGRKWLFQDLRTSKYRDGTAIPRVEDPAEWSQLNEGAYAWYDNDPANDEKFGKLYNGYTIICCEICPEGWRLPTYNEIQSIRNFMLERETLPNMVVEWRISEWITNYGSHGGERLVTGEFENERTLDGDSETKYNWSIKYAQPDKKFYDIGENLMVFRIEDEFWTNSAGSGKRQNFYEIITNNSPKSGAYIKCTEDI
jgi:uncharacterized protein (TIGR02145 family)